MAVKSGVLKSLERETQKLKSAPTFRWYVSKANKIFNIAAHRENLRENAEEFALDCGVRARALKFERKARSFTLPLI